METDAERAARLAEERLLDEAEANAERVGTIPADEVFAWLRSLGTPNPLPRPKPRRG
jgi:hypothetical protein